MRWSRSKRWVAVILGAGLALGGLVTTPASAGPVDAACADVTLVFARGSGQDVGLANREADRYLGELRDRLEPAATVNTYELGTEAIDGNQYPAVDANASNLASLRYLRSMQEGSREYVAFLTGRADRCPDEIFAVGGYSQGAHTTGNMLPDLPREVRDRIAHVTLVGDPKLTLPEGRSTFLTPVPPACFGIGFSEWRRGNVSCWTDSGSLGPRAFGYVPDDIDDRTGSWCHRDDPICNANLTDFLGSTHGKYADPGGYIDEAVAEAAEEIAARLPEDQASGIDLSTWRIAVGSDGLDLAFVVDTTGSMGSRIGAARDVASFMGGVVTSLGGRVALTEYRDSGDAFVARVRNGLTDDVDLFRSNLDSLQPSGGGDTPEATLTALMTTMNSLAWEDGATKAAVVLTDAGYHDPDRAEGWTTSDVTRRSAEIDPVNVFVVGPTYLTTAYQALTEGTSGAFVPEGSDPAGTLEDLVVDITTRPVVFFDLFDYVSTPGQSIRFSVDAFDIDAEIDRFEWDFDLDGTTDATTTTPSAEWTYDTAFDGLAEVRAISTDGGVGSATATVFVHPDGLDALAPAPATPVDGASAPGSTPDATLVSWSPGPDGGPVEAFAVSVDGDVVAIVPPGTLSVEIVVPDGARITVEALNSYQRSGTLEITGDPVVVLTDLRADVVDGAKPPMQHQLVAQLDNAIRNIEAGRNDAACTSLDQFRHLVEVADMNGQVSDADAADWTARAHAVQRRLEC